MLESLRGSGVFIDYICSGLKGHRRYKYIWKSLFTAEGASLQWMLLSGVCVHSYLIPAAALNFSPLHMSSDSLSVEIYQGEIYIF